MPSNVSLFMVVTESVSKKYENTADNADSVVNAVNADSVVVVEEQLA